MPLGPTDEAELVDEMIGRMLRLATEHPSCSFVCVVEPASIAGKGTAIDAMGP